MLPFDDDTGQRWWLQGAEHVERARALAGDVGAGLALTRPQERYDGLMPTGRATIAFRDALRLATTLRPVGTRSPAGWWCDQPVAR